MGAKYVGMPVEVFEDARTRQKREGMAIIRRVLGSVDADGFIRAEVQFPQRHESLNRASGDRVERQIEVSYIGGWV